jgi:N-methyl-L-tryptophan oxidase
MAKAKNMSRSFSAPQALWNALIKQTGEELFQDCGVLNMGPEPSEFIHNAQNSAKKFPP